MAKSKKKAKAKRATPTGKESYPSIDHIFELARTRQDIEAERLRSTLGKRLSGFFSATEKMNVRMRDLAAKAQILIDQGRGEEEMPTAPGRPKIKARLVKKHTDRFLDPSSLGTYGAWAGFGQDYFMDIKGGDQLGHANLAVATAKVGIMLDQMSQDDPMRPQLRAYWLALKEVDKETEYIADPSATMMAALKAIGDMESINITQDLQRDIDIIKGVGDQKIQYKYEDALINSAKGKVGEMLLAEVYKLFGGKSFEDAITRNNIHIAHHKGSGTLMQGIKKAFIDAALTGKKPIAVHTTDSKEMKPRLNLGTQKLKRQLKANLAKFKRTDAAVKRVRPSTAKGGSMQDFTSLMTLLNAKLPRTVAENMGVPALENRTGTFASSVRVTDVSRTAKGFPSIGYTYQRNPYQVFEMGSGKAPWATTARDPRTMIDASIREIAQELAVGRFYTRRV